MAELRDLSLKDRIYMETYRHDRFAPDRVPCAPLRTPLSEARIAVVTTAGLRLGSQPSFDLADRMGDPTFREIPADADLSGLVLDHRSGAWDRSGVLADPNVALPLSRLRELLAAGIVGPQASHHLSFMGSIVGPRRLIDQTAPAAARRLAEAGAEIALLTPV
jgi:D-proline reductase (dithiol) PrdB